MEQQFTEQEKQKLKNKKFPNNFHLLILDRTIKNKVRPCVCDLDGTIYYYLIDRSEGKHTDITLYDPEDNKEIAAISEVPVKAKIVNKKDMFLCQFNISLDGKYAGYIKIDALSLEVSLDGLAKEWSIQHSDRYSLGYSYKYSVFKYSHEVAHFRSKLLHQIPFYIMDDSDPEDRLFLILLFIIHSVHTNKKQIKEIKKEDRLARRTGLLGL